VNRDELRPPLSGWVWTTIGEVCLVVQGQSPPGNTYNTNGVGLPFLQGKA
jgi:type I restriction enzyme S subunit